MSRHPRLIYGHRGASAELPENTLESFARALEIGVDALETDVHLTADGHVVVSHDPDGRRLAAVDARIRDSLLAEVRRWDMGARYVNAHGSRPTGGPFRMPTLEELLGAFPDTVLNIDVKQEQPDMIGPLLRVLRRHAAEKRVRLASFSERNLWRIRRAGYPGPTAVARLGVVALLALPEAALRAFLPGDVAVQIPIHAGPVRLDTPRFIRRCHAVGVRVDYWTVNEPAEAIRLLAAGADGIMTDDPARIVPALADIGRP